MESISFSQILSDAPAPPGGSCRAVHGQRQTWIAALQGSLYFSVNRQKIAMSQTGNQVSGTQISSCLNIKQVGQEINKIYHVYQVCQQQRTALSFLISSNLYFLLSVFERIELFFFLFFPGKCLLDPQRVKSLHFCKL